MRTLYLAGLAALLLSCEARPYTPQSSPVNAPPQQETETVTVGEQSVQVEKQAVDSSNSWKTAAFGTQEEEWLNTNRGRARRVISHYFPKERAKVFTPEILDNALEAWTRDPAKDREQPGIVMNALAAAYGDYLMQTWGMQWTTVTDELGTDYALIDPKTQTTAFPLSGAGKAIESGKTRTFTELAALVQQSLGR